MSAEDMVAAALVGLDQGELVTIPSLHDGDEWARFEAARRALSQRFATLARKLTGYYRRAVGNSHVARMGTDKPMASD